MVVKAFLKKKKKKKKKRFGLCNSLKPLKLIGQPGIIWHIIRIVWISLLR